MKFFVNIAEMFICYVSVNLSGGNVRMTEHCLDGADVGAVTEKVGGKAVAQSVGRNLVSDASDSRVAFDYSCDGSFV